MWSQEMYLAVRSSGNATDLVPAIRSPTCRAWTVRSRWRRYGRWSELLDESLVQQRFRTWLISGFAALALLLSAIGLYALISYSVSQRTREIGVRVALGAQRSNVLGMVLREGVQLLGIRFASGIGWSIFGNAHHPVAALLHEFHRCTELHSHFAYADRRGPAGVLHSSAPGHQSGPDGRIAIRVVWEQSSDLSANGRSTSSWFHFLTRCQSALSTLIPRIAFYCEWSSGCPQRIKIPACIVQSMPFGRSDSRAGEMQIANRSTTIFLPGRASKLQSPKGQGWSAYVLGKRSLSKER